MARRTRQDAMSIACQGHVRAPGTAATPGAECVSERKERRRQQPPTAEAAALRDGLLPAQLATVNTMEQFKWELRFVRRPMFQAPVPVLFEPGGERYVVVEEDGTINHNPSLRLRP